MPTNPLRIGLLSLAHGHAFSYLNCLHARADVEVVGYYDEDDERARHVATQQHVKCFGSADALLSERLDGVIVCAANAHHRRWVEAAAGNVRAILCEKPIATTLADAQAMIDLCVQRATKLQIAFPVRFAPPVQWLKALLDRGDLGRIYAVQTTNHGGMPGGWFVDPTLAGGGAVMDHTVHVIDLLRWFWNTEVTEVYAEVGVNLLHPDLGIDDVGLLSFTLANGVYGTLDTSWSRPLSHPVRGDVKIEVMAENGVVYLDAFRQHLTVSSNQTGRSRWEGWGSNMDQGLVDDFVDLLHSGREPSISGEDGLAALAVALAAYRSAELGEPVKVENGLI